MSVIVWALILAAIVWAARRTGIVSELADMAAGFVVGIVGVIVVGALVLWIGSGIAAAAGGGR